MDRLSRAWYEKDIALALRSKQGNEFQDFFSQYMELAHPGDFQRVRAYGNRGDLKCDGYLESGQVVFQAYATRTMKRKPLLTKIRQDFAGACRHWEGRMREWTFVHNDWDGLPADALQLLLDLANEHPEANISRLGPSELQQRMLQLDESGLASLFDPAPTYLQFDDLGFERLRPVLIHISRSEPPSEQRLRPVSPEKLSANAFSLPVAELLKIGRHKEELVERLLATWPDPTFGEGLAQTFRQRYAEADATGLTPDEIFGQLQAFAGGSRVAQDTAHQAAVLAVLSYFFERCDIFKDHPEAAS